MCKRLFVCMCLLLSLINENPYGHMQASLTVASRGDGPDGAKVQLLKNNQKINKKT